VSSGCLLICQRRPPPGCPGQHLPCRPGRWTGALGGESLPSVGLRMRLSGWLSLARGRELGRDLAAVGIEDGPTVRQRLVETARQVRWIECKAYRLWQDARLRPGW